MPKNTGIYQHKEYIERLLEEDKKIAGKDTPYGRYLKALTELTTYTNEIYASGGELTKETHGKLLERYMNVAEMCVQYREKGDSKERRSVVDYIQKLISRDVKALNSVDKENPGKIQDIFEESRTIRVKIPDELKHRVGGEANDRFPMVDTDGRKGFFTARSDAAQDKKWNEMLDNAKAKFKLTDQQMENINKLRTNYELRKDVAYGVAMVNYEEEKPYRLAIDLGICKNMAEANDLLAENRNMYKALEYIADNADKMVTPINFQDRLSYDPYTRTDNKNAAMYDVAKLLGCEKLVAKAVPMIVVNGDKVLKGTFMEHAEGSDISNLSHNDPLHKYDMKTSPYNKDLYRDLADLQLLDYICGNVDRHKGNMIYKTAQVKDGIALTGVIAIDNDASFPEGAIPENELESTENRSARIFKPENFRFVNEKTAEFVRGLTRGKLDLVLRGHNISQKAIDLAWERTKEVQDALEKRKENNITYVSEIDERNGLRISSEKDPFNSFGYEKKPSIFSNFNTSLSKRIYPRLQDKYYKINIPQSENISREDSLLIDIEKVARLDTRMDRINRLKTPSEEFASMRDAMFDLKQYTMELRSKIIRKEELKKTDYNKYKEYLDVLNSATKNYIEKKGISPRTAKGRERLQAARSFETNVMELINNFEKDQKLEKPKSVDMGYSFSDEESIVLEDEELGNY